MYIMLDRENEGLETRVTYWVPFEATSNLILAFELASCSPLPLTIADDGTLLISRNLSSSSR
jgi:hypothetical protein